ncbi:MAG: peptidase S15 [Gaiellaceae bacterium]|nr:MAG: peptidase S15 [Gaiellaceae bacterium]
MEEVRARIPLADGTRLAARLFLPSELPAAVLLEALPYRMDDLTASYASEYVRLCEEGGFAVCRLDLRGTGSSEGIALDEYHPQEQTDLQEVIAWLAEQEWSTGRVGMFGTSWSGFNALQVAMERPPALGAIVSVYASDDRYTDDVHYLGGVLKALDLVDWELYMAASNALPPVPAVFGEGWREEWRRRLEVEPWLLRWLSEQVDGPYWRHGSLRPRYERIACPTMLVAGWADGYTNIVFRALERLRCPLRVLVGPWSHTSPATSIPGPRIDLVPELVRWFARWLRDEENDIDEEPPLVFFARRSTLPAPDLEELRGEWRSEPSWPPARLREQTLRPEGEGTDEIAVQGDVGVAAWISCAGKPPWVLPDDQREDDERSLVYEWGPLPDELEILGHPRVRVTVTSQHAVAFLSARLCDVWDDGTSALVTRGILNLAHRGGHDRPVPLEPGVPTPIELELEATSWTFERGQRIRLALAGSDWPNTWPPPHGGRLLVERGSLELVLPVLDGPPIAPAPSFLPAPESEAEPAESEPAAVRRIERDPEKTRVVVGSETEYDAPFGARVAERYEGEVGVWSEEPGRAWARARSVYRIVWPDATAQTEARLDLRSSATEYLVRIDLVAEEEGGAFSRVERRYERRIPRRLQ